MAAIGGATPAQSQSTLSIAVRSVTQITLVALAALTFLALPWQFGIVAGTCLFLGAVCLIPRITIQPWFNSGWFWIRPHNNPPSAPQLGLRHMPGGHHPGFNPQAGPRHVPGGNSPQMNPNLLPFGVGGRHRVGGV